MRRSIIFASIFMLLAIAGCEGINPFGEKPEDGLSISLNCGIVDTKTTETGTEEGVGNENLIKTVDYFLFNAATANSATYYYKGRATANATSHFTFYISSSLIELGDYVVYTIVNYPGDESDLGVNGKSNNDSDKRTMDQLKALLLDESAARTFTASPSSGKITPAAEANLALVMTGSGTMSVTANASGLHIGSSTIDLSRLASKVSIDFYIKDQIVRTINETTETWVPLTDGNNIRVYLCNGAQSVYLGGTVPTTLSLFDYQPNTGNTAITGKTDYTTAFSSAAFYTYPESWTQGGADEPYLKIIIPWRLTRTIGSDQTTSQKECYYKVMLPNTSFAANCWYQLILDIAQVGSDTDEDIVNLVSAYQVTNWGTYERIASAMTPAYYLEVNESAYDLSFYGDELDIPYFASGSITIADVSITKTDFTNTSNPTQTVANDGYVAKGTDSDYIAIRHPLNTDYSGNSYDVSAYEFTFRLHLDDAGTSTVYDKTLHVTQYPPLYITQVRSDGNVFVYDNAYNNNTATAVYDEHYKNYNGTALAANTFSSRGTHFMGNLTNPANITGTGTNNSPWILEVQATILDFDIELDGVPVKVVIGDPRTDGAYDFGACFNGLSNYRPTADNTQNVISPRFRIASSYGKTGPLTYEGAMKRCASYQENGYPAGRWRLPTAAEIEFLIKLSNDGKVTSLFQPDIYSGYWAGGMYARFGDGGATGPDLIKSMNGISASFGTVNQPSPYQNLSNQIGYEFDGARNGVWARCVYDTWYWGEGQYTGYNNAWLGFQTTTPTL